MILVPPSDAGRGLVELDPELVELRGFPDEKTLAINSNRNPEVPHNHRCHGHPNVRFWQIVLQKSLM